MGRQIGCFVLLLMTGCTIQVQPWGKTPGATGEAPGGPGPTTVPALFHGPMPKPLPMPTVPMPAPNVNNNEMARQMLKELNEADDHRKALLEQVNILKRQVREREDSLRLASHEMEDSSVKLKRTREEFRQWETEMTELRERVRKLEENRRAVAQLIEEIMNHLDRPREPLRLPPLNDKSK